MLTTREVADIFHVEMQTVRRWVKIGWIPAEQDKPYDPLQFDDEQVRQALEAYQGSDAQRHQLRRLWSPPDLEEEL